MNRNFLGDLSRRDLLKLGAAGTLMTSLSGWLLGAIFFLKWWSRSISVRRS